MTGTLGLFSLVDLFQLLASSSRTGRLLIDHPQGTARVYFDKGRVVHADFEALRGQEAVFALFNDERGSFEFSLGLPAPENTIQLSTENLLLDAIRRVDEARHNEPEAQQSKKASIAEDIVPYIADDAPDAGNLTLYAQEVMILRLVDGQRNVSHIAQEAGIALEEVQSVVSRLVKVGALSIRGRKARVARLVAQLAKDNLPNNTVGIDRDILNTWEEALGRMPNRVACRRPNGKVDVFDVQPIDDAGTHLLFSRDTLFAANLAANTALLVKPTSQ